MTSQRRTLAGSGSAGGNVTIGDGLGGADTFIAPGNSAGTFTVGGSLSLLSDATFVFELNSTNGSTDKIVANGVTLDSSAFFSFNDIGLGTGVIDGQVFTLIDNTSGSAISGQFANLTNGSSIVSQGVTYRELHRRHGQRSCAHGLARARARDLSADARGPGPALLCGRRRRISTRLLAAAAAAKLPRPYAYKLIE